MGPARITALRKAADQHKYNHGHALVLSGGAGRTGAARLAARAALRVGAGLVTLGVPRDALAEVAGHVTAVMVRRVDRPADFAGLIDDPRVNAACLGPGFGTGAVTRDYVTTFFDIYRDAILDTDADGFRKMEAQGPKRLVLDADALTVFEDRVDDLFEVTRRYDPVLTPHMGEFRRVFPDLSGLAPARACHLAAERAGCTVLLKGRATYIASPGSHVAVHNSDGQRDAPWLATAGSGDVLAGLITGLLARRYDPQDAAEVACWLHTEAARRVGPGLIAEDLPEAVPAVFRSLGV